MLETITASKPASRETFIRSAAAFGSGCFIASSRVATSRGWPRRTWPGFGREIEPGDPGVLSPPAPTEKPIATAATAAAPSSARAGPFHLMGGEPTHDYA